jgi:hypothetical protein
LAAPGGDLADHNAHQGQQDSGLNVRSALDGEPLVRSGEKELEPRTPDNPATTAATLQPGRTTKATATTMTNAK